MMINVDLNDLTADMVLECLPHLGQCSYAAPCIIGTLLPKEARREFDDRGDCDNSAAVDHLVCHNKIKFPSTNQLDDAIELQDLFDNGDRLAFISHPRIKALGDF